MTPEHSIRARSSSSSLSGSNCSASSQRGRPLRRHRSKHRQCADRRRPRRSRKASRVRQHMSRLLLPPSLYLIESAPSPIDSTPYLGYAPFGGVQLLPSEESSDTLTPESDGL